MIVLQKGKSYFSVALVNQRTDYTGEWLEKILSVAVPITFFFITEEDDTFKKTPKPERKPCREAAFEGELNYRY